MSRSPIDDIIGRIRLLQTELEHELDHLLNEKRRLFRYTLEQGRVRFERSMESLQRGYKIGLWTYLRSARPAHVLTAPIIYLIIFPSLALDLTVSVYQHVCFRVYGIPRVSRKDYFIMDHHQLAYLNIIEKFNCIYCGYTNGLIEYVREISARTEQYWCPIKHARRTPDPHYLVRNFVDYGDAEAFKQKLDDLQREVRELDNS